MRDPVELIRQFCRDGDAAAFREFYRTQSPRLWKFLVARLPLEEKSDLVFQSLQAAQYIQFQTGVLHFQQ
mgnify:CR=1 FL=1